MKNVSDISKKQKKRLANDLEKEKEKIVSDKVQKLQDRQILEKKQEIARAIEQEEENRRIQLNKAYKSEPAIIRGIYSIKSLFSQGTPAELYHESLLAELTNKIQKAGRGLVLSNTKMISGKFISELYKAFLMANNFAAILKPMFKQSKSLEIYTRYAFKHLYKDIDMNRNLSEVIDLDLLREKIQQSGETLREYLTKQYSIIRKYSMNINPVFASSLVNSLNDFYYLFLFINFGYKKFFIALGGSIITLKTGRFDDCIISMSLKAHFENFYQFVPMLSKLETNDVAKYILSCGIILAENDQEISLENITKKVSENEELLKRLGEFCKIWNTKISKYPFSDLIRLCSSNYFYNPRSIELSSLKMKDRIKRFVEKQLLSELDIFIKQVRNECNADAKEDFLIDYEHSLLQYYRNDSIVNTGRFPDVPGFGHVDEVNIIYNFLTKYYTINIKRIFVYLVRKVFSKTSLFRTVLMNQSMALDNLEERLRIFNSELSPERAWGKNLMNIIYRLEKNDTGNLLHQIRVQIQAIDTEANNLLELANTTFETVVSQLQSIAISDNPKLNEALSVPMPNSSRQNLLSDIANAVHAFKSIQALVRSYYKL